MQRVYIHGSGHRGRDAWPAADPDSGAFIEFPRTAPISRQVAALEERFCGIPIVLFAHSLGGVTAALTASRGLVDVRALVLVEPALYDIARGTPAIERHIAIHTEARAQAASGNLRGFWALVRPVMFGGPSDEARWPHEKDFAEEWSRAELPWGHGIRPGMLLGIPTLVVTGAWNEEYETIARFLAAECATHRQLAGAEHRAQDLPDFAQLTEEFLGEVLS